MTCIHCDEYPARVYLPDTRRSLCGVCAHRLVVAQDLARRIARVK